MNLFERRKRGVHFALVVFFFEHPDMLDQITERNHFGNIQRALDLVQHIQPFRFHRLGNVDVRVRSGPSPHVVAVHRRVQRVQFQLGVPEPVPQFVDLRLVPIIQMLARAEDLHRRYPRLPDLVQPDGVQAMIHQQVSG